MATYAHEVEVSLADGSDPAAVGAAITVELCGHWEHDGPCLYPHHTAVISRSDQLITARVVFVCPADAEGEVRRRILAAVASGSLEANESSSEWTLEAARVMEVTAEDRQLGFVRGDEATR